MTKFFNRSAAQAEATRLARVIQKHDPTFTPSPLSFSVGKFNREIDELNARVAAAESGGKVIHRLSVPNDSPTRGGSAKPAVVVPSPWGHIHDPECRALLTKAMPGGPSQLKAVATAATAPAETSVAADYAAKLPKAKNITPAALEKIALSVLNNTFIRDRDPAVQLWQNHIDLSTIGLPDDHPKFRKAYRTAKTGMTRVMASVYQDNFDRHIY